MSNYGDIANVKESAGFIPCGINEVIVIDAKLETIAGNNYNGEVLDVYFQNKSGGVHKKRHFPFQFSASYTDRKTGEVIPEAKQFDDYNTKIKHLYTKAFKGTEEEFNAAFKGVTTFAQYANTLIGLLKTKPDTFRCKFVDKGGYSSIPDFTGGVAEKLDVNPTTLKYDPIKEGPKPSTTTTTAGNGSQDDLPF